MLVPRYIQIRNAAIWDLASKAMGEQQIGKLPVPIAVSQCLKEAEFAPPSAISTFLPCLFSRCSGRHPARAGK